MSPHLPHGALAWTIAAACSGVLPIALTVHLRRNRPDEPAHPPTGALPLVEGRRVSTLLPARAGVRAMFDPGKGTRP